VVVLLLKSPSPGPAMPAQLLSGPFSHTLPEMVTALAADPSASAAANASAPKSRFIVTPLNSSNAESRESLGSAENPCQSFPSSSAAVPSAREDLGRRSPITFARAAGRPSSSGAVPSDVMLLERDELTSGSTWHAAGLLPLFNMSYATSHIHDYS
jgi:hypothetical protein